MLSEVEMGDLNMFCVCVLWWWWWMLRTKKTKNNQETYVKCFLRVDTCVSVTSLCIYLCERTTTASDGGIIHLRRENRVIGSKSVLCVSSIETFRMWLWVSVYVCLGAGVWVWVIIERQFITITNMKTAKINSTIHWMNPIYSEIAI